MALTDYSIPQRHFSSGSPAATLPISNPKTLRGRVLMLDDDRQLVAVISELLNYMGYKIFTCYTGEELLNYYSQHSTEFDIVVLDLTINGGMNGVEVLGKLLEITPQIKAIAASGCVETDAAENYKSYGFSEIIAKPYSALELSRIINRLVK